MRKTVARKAAVLFVTKNLPRATIAYDDDNEELKTIEESVSTSNVGNYKNLKKEWIQSWNKV